MNSTKRYWIASVGVLGHLISSYACADFVSDSKLNLGVRNFYFNNDNRDGDAAPSKTEEWGQGFMLDFKSGFTAGTIGFGVDALGLLGITLDSGGGRHVGSSMIPSDGSAADDSWSRLGLTAKTRFSKTEARLGTLIPKLPVLVANDGRLLPQTFQGAMITSNEIDRLTLVAGKIEQATGRGSSDRTGLAVTGGQQESNAFYFAGGDFKATPQLTLQYYYATLDDYYRQHFTGLVHVLPLGEGQSFKTDLRYFKTDADGANSSGKAGYQVSGFTREGTGEIDNHTWSASFTYAAGGHSLMAGYQRVSDNSAFVQLNQGSLAGGVDAGGASLGLLTDRMVTTFTRAGENTKFAQYSYNFAALGVPGLKASVMYLSGDNIKTSAGVHQKEWERDTALDYAFQSGPLKGVGVAWYNAMLRSDAVRNQDQNRLVVNYTIPLL
ncbi:OprD family porin [Pseudomonas fluorescens]|uniref:OprD family porin n=1 Tax=Pseudomonas fluorescens TaxID=294 RepID=UPI002ACA4E60|nr:OprD family porin [Pseudomonas fluorescens]MDZ5431923.1 OprD family porin [Pseudomonas fluorescens]